MAKDLPYFKFFCSEWNDGNITLEDYKIQGVFINVCSYYWSKECNLEEKLLYKRFKTVSNEIDILVSENHLKILNGVLRISFLDEQKEEREERSKIRRKGGIASAEAKRLNKIEQESNKDSTQIQHVLNSSSTQPQVLREEKRREEEIREDNISNEKNTNNSLTLENQITEEHFIKRWKDARLHYDKQPTLFKKLISIEKVGINELKKDYNIKEFDRAIQGLFQQNTFPVTRLRPTHFLKRENFETYLTCFTTKEKLFDNNKYKKVDRI